MPQIELAAAPLGALPLAFLRNQLTFCGLICPFIVQGAVTVPHGALMAPAAFVQTLQHSGNLLQAIGAAATSVTQPATDAAEGIIGNDLNLVLPKAQDTLEVAVVQAIDVLSGATSLGKARTTILQALDQPPGMPTIPTGAHGIFEVSLVESINVASAVAFQGGETVLLGVVQTANAAATTLAHTGDIGESLRAGAAQARTVANVAGGQITTAVDTAVTNIHAALHNSPHAALKAPTSAAALPHPSALQAQGDVGNRHEAGLGRADRGNSVHSLHRGRHAG